MAIQLTSENLLLGAAAVGGVMAVAAIALPDRHSRIRTRLDAMKPVVAEGAGPGGPAAPAIGERMSSLGDKIIGSFLIGPKEQEKMVELLGSAGISGKDKVAMFVAGKFTLAIILIVLSWVLVYVTGLFQSTWYMRVLIILVFALVGWRAPDMVVNSFGTRRKRRLRDGISDALDLMVICTEAGLGLEQGMDRVARDIAVSNPVVSEELKKTTAEMKVLPQMRDALDNFAKRSGLPIVKSVVTTLVQSIQYGTPLSHSLRVLSGEMRAHRMLEIERKAAQLPVLLTLPLIMFILPCLFLIVAGPAVLNTIATFAGHR
ncbi:MAG TPA: type II secretion system F family protein [Stellaceae bacterium]|nr:type II secretion system F family protein [Stellaceae bacterium]